MSKCLITKLLGVANNSNLPFLYDFDFYHDGLLSIPWLNVIDKSAPLPWNDTNNVSPISYLTASNGDQAYSVNTNKYRILSDFIPVIPGMVITTNLINSANVPVLICYDADKQPLGPSPTYCIWKTSDYETIVTLTIPEGVKYITVNVTGINTGTISNYFIKGEMPTE